MVVRDLLDAFDVYLRRALRLGAVVFDLHWDIARQEAVRERQRLATGSVLVLIGVGFLMTAVALVQVAAIWLARSLGLSWLLAILSVAAIDFVAGSLLAGIGSQMLRGPYMVQTQERLARTTATLTGQNPPLPRDGGS